MEPLNRWLGESASQQEQNNTARTYVACPRHIAEWHAAGFDWVTENSILGYYALSSGQVEASYLPARAARKLPKAVPIVRLGRLAVDKRLQGMGLGNTLLMEAIVQTVEAAESIGIAGLFVDAKAGAVRFYEQYGFTANEDDPLKLWYPLGSLRKLLLNDSAMP